MAAMVKILRGWFQDLLFFTPKNLKIVGLITLRLMRDMYRLMVHHYIIFFMIPLLLLIVGSFILYRLVRCFFTAYAWLYCLYTFLIIIRPSMQIKSSVYMELYDLPITVWQKKVGWFKQYQWMIAVLLAFMVILYWIVAYSVCLASYFFALSGSGWICSPALIIGVYQGVISLFGGPVVLYSFFINDFGPTMHPMFSTGVMMPYVFDQSLALLAPFFVVSSPIFICATLFLLDSGMNTKAKKDSLFGHIYNAFKMVFYNMPLFFAFQSISYSLLFAFYALGHMHPYCVYVLPYVAFVLYPIILCFYAGLYTKYSYEQVALYCLGPK